MALDKLKRIVVTGGAGFIGSHLVDRLIGEGYRVTAIDNLATGSLEHLRQNAREPRFDLLEWDINDVTRSTAAYSGAESVIHLAGLADIVPSVLDPAGYHRANVSGTLSVLECCRLAGVKKVIYAASSSCYGIPSIFPTPETASLKPEYPYALTKMLGEQYVLSWGKFYRMNVNSLRLFNVFGPRSRAGNTYGAVFRVFLSQKLNGLPFTVVGDGAQSRDFIYVSDVVGAILSTMRSEVSGEIMNVGTGSARTVNELVRLLAGPVVHVPRRPGEPQKTQADIAKIKRLLGWEALVSFEQGVRWMLDNIDQWSGAPLWTPPLIEEATRGWFTHLGGHE